MPPNFKMASALNRFNLGEFNSGTYTPAIHDLEDVSQANPALVTTVDDHDYVVNQQVQFFIPPQWGMRQLNQLKGYVLTLPADDQFTVSIDTSQFDAFNIPSPPAFVVIDPAQVAGIGDVNYGQFSPGGVVTLPQTIPGAFQNHRPT